MFFDRIEYKTPAQMLKMRRAGLVVAAIHQALRAEIAPGMTTKDLDDIAARVLKEHGAKSNFLGYYDYPAHICVSVNEEIVHGIPGKRVLRAGDLVSMDCGAVVGGWHGDACFTTVVGGEAAADPADLWLIDVTERAMWAGIAAFARGKYVNDIGEAIEAVALAEPEEKQPGIVEEYTGHGIGTRMHQPPDVLNYATRSKGARLKPGMALCIEPMFTAGSAENVTLGDGWTVVTQDGSRAVHVEHEVVRHAGGIWVITAPDGGEAGLAPFGIKPVPLQS